MPVTEASEELAHAAELYLRSRESEYFGPNDVQRIVGSSQVWVRMTKPDSTVVRFIADCVLLSCRVEYPNGEGAYSQPFVDDYHAIAREMGQGYIAMVTEAETGQDAYVT